MKKSKSYKLAVVSGSIVVCTLLLRYAVLDMIIQTIISSKIKLAKGNDIWNIWSEMPIPMFSKFYFFNVTNPDEIQEGAKPILKEMGPYVYQETRHKIILESNDDIVRYRPKTTYHFRPDLSHGSQDDYVTLLNVPFVGVAKIAWDLMKDPIMLSTLDDLLSGDGETLFHKNKVREFLFDGFSIENYMELFSLPVEAFGGKAKFTVPDRILDGDFGFFDDRNGTADQVWVVGTGIKDRQTFGKIMSYNGRTSLDDWKDEQCNKIEGTDGTIFPPLTDISKILNIFHPDACRTLQLSYVEPGEFLEVPTLRYSFAKNTFGSLDDYPENECFCKETYAWCKKGGVFPLWPCVGGAPVFISPPHFMDSHPEYRNSVIGLNHEGDYSTLIDVEPNIGLPIRAGVKLQINMELQSFPSMASFVNVPNLMFPLIWMEETAEVTNYIGWPLRVLNIVLKVSDFLTEIILFNFTFLFLVGFVIEARKQNWLGRCCGIKFG